MQAAFGSQMRNVGDGGFQQLGRAAVEAGGRIQYLGGQMAGFGRSMSTKVTLPLAAVGVGLYKAMQLGADLVETQNKVRVVFGRSAGQMLKWGSGAAQAMGLSNQAALEGASSIGAMLRPMGFAPTAAAQMSRKMTQLAADMASFNNEDPTDMLDRIRSGLSGEMEPLKRYGTVLSENRVQQFAWTHGIAKSGQQLTEQQKVMARYGLLLQDTKQQQGDFARTSDSLANRQRILKANLQDSATTLGMALIPVATKVANILSKTLIPAVVAVARWFKNLPEGVTQFLVVSGSVVAVMGPMVWGIGKLISTLGMMVSGFGKAIIMVVNFSKYLSLLRIALLINIGMQKAAAAATKAWAVVQAAFNAVMAMNPIVLVVLAVAALVAAVIIAYEKVGWFRDAVNAVWNEIKTWATIMWSILQPILSVVGEVLKGIGRVILTIVVAAFKVWWAVAKVVIDAIVTYFKFLWSIAQPIIKAMAAVINAVLVPVFKFLWSSVKQTFGNIISAYKTVKSTFTSIGTNLKKTVNATRDDIKKAFNDAIAFIKGLPTRAKNAARDVGNAIKNGITDGIRGLGEIVKSALNKVIDLWNKLDPRIAFSKTFRLFGKEFTGSINTGDLLPDVGKLATGTRSAPGGMTLVGEQGPELVNLPRGAAVYTASQTSRILSGGPAPLPNMGPPQVRVFIGDRELTDIVRVEMGERDRVAAGAYAAGVVG